MEEKSKTNEECNPNPNFGIDAGEWSAEKSQLIGKDTVASVVMWTTTLKAK